MNIKRISLIVAIFIFLGIIFWQLFLREAEIKGSATLSWDENKEDALAGYRIYYGQSPRSGNCPQGGYSKKIDVGNATSYKINDLDNNSDYYFSVTSYNSAGKESCFSAEMQKTVKLTIIDKLKVFFNK